jgi:hypothetical protein
MTLDTARAIRLEGAILTTMTADEYQRKLRDPKWYGDQDENGVDLSLIRENLKLTPTERIRKADLASLGMMRLRNDARITPGKPS